MKIANNNSDPDPKKLSGLPSTELSRSTNNNRVEVPDGKDEPPPLIDSGYSLENYDDRSDINVGSDNRKIFVYDEIEDLQWSGRIENKREERFDTIHLHGREYRTIIEKLKRNCYIRFVAYIPPRLKYEQLLIGKINFWYIENRIDGFIKLLRSQRF